MLKRINIAVALLGLLVFTGVLFADVPFFWLDKPKGRSNRNDPKSPLFYVTETPVPIGSTATFTRTPTLTATPTMGTGGGATATFTPTPTSAVTGWPTIYDGDNVALGGNYYMAITGTGQGGVVESSGSGAHGSGIYAHVTLAAAAYAGAVIFNTGYDAGGVPQFHDASPGNPDGVVSLELSLRIPAGSGNCYPPAVKLVSDNGLNQYQSKPVTITPYIVETGGVASGPAIMKPGIWYTARIPLSVFLGDNGQAGADNHNFTNADLARLHGVAIQPMNGAYDDTGAFSGEIDVDDIKLVGTAAPAGTGYSTVVDTFESVKGQTLWGNYWSLNADSVTCHSPVTSLSYGTNGQSPVDAGGNTNGSACRSAHLYGYLTQANGDYGPSVPPCSSANNDYGYLNVSASLHPNSTASTFYPVDLSNNTWVPSLPAGGATGLRLWLKRGPNCGNTVIKVFLERASANGGDQFFVLIRTADIPNTHFKKFELPFPNDGQQSSTGGAWPPPSGNNTPPPPGGTACHADAGDPAVVAQLTSSELWWGQPWYFGTKKAWGRTDFTQVGVGAIERGSTVDIYIDDVEFY